MCKGIVDEENCRYGEAVDECRPKEDVVLSTCYKKRQDFTEAPKSRQGFIDWLVARQVATGSCS
jgi:hypothetical protein